MLEWIQRKAPCEPRRRIALRIRHRSVACLMHHYARQESCEDGNASKKVITCFHKVRADASESLPL